MNLLGRYRFLNTLNGLFFRYETTARRFGNASTPTLRDVMLSWKRRFEESQIPEADTSIRLIASNIMNIKRLDDLEKFHSSKLTEDQEMKLNLCCECRLARMPVQYIIKEWDFRDLTLKMVPPVFIPRPETELLVDIVVKNTDNLNTALEIGCGSGAISVSLLQEIQHLKMTAIDQSKLACDLSLTNARMNKVDERLKIFHRKLDDDGHIPNFEPDQIDVIVSNPPYLLSSELRQLEPEIKLFEDLRALDGGIDGLRVIKAILKFSSSILQSSKSCFLEIHHDHIPLIQRWIDDNVHLNLRLSGTFKDVFGYDRFVRVSKINK